MKKHLFDNFKMQMTLEKQVISMKGLMTRRHHSHEHFITCTTNLIDKPSQGKVRSNPDSNLKLIITFPIPLLTKQTQISSKQAPMPTSGNLIC